MSFDDLIFPNLEKNNLSPQSPEAEGIIISSQTNISPKSEILPLFGVIQSSNEDIKECINSTILALSYGPSHTPYSNHIFKELVIFEDDFTANETNSILYFNINAYIVCNINPKSGSYYLIVSSRNIQSNIVKIEVA